jgi:hypothetical protein
MVPLLFGNSLRYEMTDIQMSGTAGFSCLPPAMEKLDAFIRQDYGQFLRLRNEKLSKTESLQTVTSRLFDSAWLTLPRQAA